MNSKVKDIGGERTESPDGRWNLKRGLLWDQRKEVKTEQGSADARMLKWCLRGGAGPVSSAGMRVLDRRHGWLLAGWF